MHRSDVEALPFSDPVPTPNGTEVLDVVDDVTDPVGTLEVDPLEAATAPDQVPAEKVGADQPAVEDEPSIVDQLSLEPILADEQEPVNPSTPDPGLPAPEPVEEPGQPTVLPGETPDGPSTSLQTIAAWVGLAAALIAVANFAGWV